MKTTDKVAYQKGILEGLRLVEKMYKHGDLNPGNLIDMIEVHQDQLKYLEFLNQQAPPFLNQQAPPPPPLEKPTPHRQAVDRAGQIIKQQPSVSESIGIKKELYVLFYVVVLVVSIISASLMLVKPWFNGLR